MAELTKDEKVREEILKEAQKLFKQYGLKKTTMDEIAAACGKAKSTLYHYFKSKEEVFDAVFAMELQSLRVIVKDSVAEQKLLKDKMMTYFTCFHEEIMNKVNLYRAVKLELLNDQKSQTHFHRLMQFEKSYITRMLEDAFDAGEFTGFTKEEIPWFSEIMIAAFFGIVRHSIEVEGSFDKDNLNKVAQIFIPRLFI